jgi:hypothetical protein
LNGIIVALVLTLTVSLATVIGIVAAYAAINGILFAFNRQARPPKPPAPVLATGNSPVSGD